MIRTGMAILLVILLFMSAEVRSQQRIAAAAAQLQLTGETTKGEELMATSKNLVILYEQSIGKGEIDLGSLQSSHPELLELFDGMTGKVLHLSFAIPPGKFAFGDAMNERFTTQGQLTLGEMTSEFTLELDVSNIKNSRENNFKVIGSGRLSLAENFGVHDHHLVRDGFGFVFNQNLNVFQP